MKYMDMPLSFAADDAVFSVRRGIDNRIMMIDRLIELIVLTPRGSFNADPDFGFEYWNHEWSNVRFRDFNNGQPNGCRGDVTKKECQESILGSLADYCPGLKRVEVQIELNMADESRQGRKNVLSKYFVNVTVTGLMGDGLGTDIPYRKEVAVLMEPAARKI